MRREWEQHFRRREESVQNYIFHLSVILMLPFTPSRSLFLMVGIRQTIQSFWTPEKPSKIPSLLYDLRQELMYRNLQISVGVPWWQLYFYVFPTGITPNTTLDDLQPVTRWCYQPLVARARWDAGYTEDMGTVSSHKGPGRVACCLVTKPMVIPSLLLLPSPAHFRWGPGNER